MNSNQRFILLLFIIINSLSSATCSNSQNGKISLELYYESLCPYCSNFIVNGLTKLFQDEDGLASIVDLKLIPYGNARIGSNSSITCQHGPSECLLNTVEACAIDAWPEVTAHFPFIHCVETLVYEHKFPEWETCFEKLGLDPKTIQDCYTSGYGTELELRYAAVTSSLEPPHEYVPWVVVDGQPLYEDYENFISYICKAYNSTAVPRACSKIQLDMRNAEPGHPVCYKETTTLSTRIRSAVISWMNKFNMAA